MTTVSDMAQRRALARANSDPEYLLRRTELIDAAARVFRIKGFSATKLQDVAAEVGLDRATIYYYVSGKEELFQDVVAGAVRANVLLVVALHAQEGRADSKIATLIEALLDAYERHYPYLYVYVQEDMAHMKGNSAWSQEMRSSSKRFDVAVRGIVQQGLDEGSITSPINDARLIANAIIGMCNWTHRWFHPKTEGAAKGISDVFSTLVLRGLIPRPE